MYMNDGNKTKINLRNKSVFITGVAGFIGSNLAKRLLSTVEGADEEGLQKQPEQGAYIHLHQAGFQHRQANVVDTGISGNDTAGIRHHLLCQVKDRHHNIEGVGDEPDRHRRFEDPAHDEGWLKLRHVVVLGDHLN